MKFSKDGRCKFDPESHSYYIGEKQLTGVTTYISKYKNFFDAEKIAEKFAKKNGLDKDELLKKWEEEGKQSCINGTMVHDVFEKYIINGKIITTGKNHKEKVAVKFIDEFFKTGRLKPVDAEVIIYNEGLGLASMIDCIARNEAGKYFILDWKTSKKIETNSYGKNMLPPYCQLPDANYYHYSLQLSLYRLMYREHEISGIFIVHIGDENYEVIKANTVTIQ
jgi:ATP-dependent exoDNAse (exonuclease V) beta subunit